MDVEEVNPAHLAPGAHKQLLDIAYAGVVRHIFEISRADFGDFVSRGPGAEIRYWICWKGGSSSLGGGGVAGDDTEDVSSGCIREMVAFNILSAEYLPSVVGAPQLGSVILFRGGMSVLKEYRTGVLGRQVIPRMGRFAMGQTLRHPLSTMFTVSTTLSPQGAAVMHMYSSGRQWPRPGEPTPPDIVALMRTVGRGVGVPEGDERAHEVFFDPATGAVTVNAPRVMDAKGLDSKKGRRGAGSAGTGHGTCSSGQGGDGGGGGGGGGGGTSADSDGLDGRRAMQELYVRLNPRWQEGRGLVMLLHVSWWESLLTLWTTFAPWWLGGGQRQPHAGSRRSRL